MDLEIKFANVFDDDGSADVILTDEWSYEERKIKTHFDENNILLFDIANIEKCNIVENLYKIINERRI